MQHAILFDFNGVILDDEPIHLRLFNEGLAPLGYRIDAADYYDKYVGFDDTDGFAAAVADQGGNLDRAVLDRLIREKAVRYQALMDSRPPLFPGAAELIRRLAHRYPLAIASGALRGEIEGVLATVGLADSFQVIVAAEDVSRGKPDPEGYLIALAALRHGGQPALTADRCLVIEDTVAGVVAAKAAGMRCLAVAHTYPAERLHQADLVRPTIAAVNLEEIDGVLA
jgi:HAD superfamily hydrolase (TIGR01509 family)